ncbi:MAG: T9SS type A sorting domain-containing protein [Ignavibacteriaceae bacterium]
METRLNFLYLETFLLLLCLLSSNIKAQDSLYLVGTITGSSYETRITDIDRIGDVNGDGYDDFMVSRRTGSKTKDQGIIQIYFGSPNLDLIPNIVLHYPDTDTLNDLGNASEIGDINGDGYDDFTVTGAFGDWGYTKGKVFLYYGGANIDTIPVAKFYEPWIQDYFGSVIEKVGDLDKDGYDDFTVSSTYNWSNGKGYVYLFWGGDTISLEKSITFASDSLGDFFGESVANIGDINNDGFDDIAIGAPNIGSTINPGTVYVYFSDNFISVIPDTILKGNYINEGFGSIIKNSGDLDNNNKIEYLIGGGGYVYIYEGININTTINGFEMGIGGFINVESNCDLNNDGYGDFITGNTNYRNSDSLMVGGAFVYFGKKTIDTVYTITLEGENKWDEFSRIMSAADINGDGYDELFILASNYPDYNNPQGKIYIYSYKNLTNIEDHKDNVPSNFKLNQNYPNPFNPTTNIQFSIPKQNFVTLKVYDVLGREVATLVDEEKLAGEHKVEFDAAKYKLSSGIYFCELKMKGGNSSRIKMVLIK